METFQKYISLKLFPCILSEKPIIYLRQLKEMPINVVIIAGYIISIFKFEVILTNK